MKSQISVFAVALLSFTLASASIGYCAPPPNACSLLTPEQVGAVLGAKIEAGKALGASLCMWRGAQGKKITLNLISPAAFAYAKTPVGNGIIKTEVSGIGDDAVYVSTHGAPTTLTVKKHNTAFTIVVYGFSDDLSKAKEKTLAVEVCSKL